MWIHRSRDRDLLDFFFFFLFLLRQKTQTGRGFLMSRCVSVLCNRWTSHKSVPLPPSPPSSTPDRYQTPRVFGVSSSTPVDFPRTVSNRDDCSRARCSWKREKKKKEKIASVLHPLHERKYVLSLSTFVRVNDRRAKIGTWMRGKG